MSRTKAGLGRRDIAALRLANQRLVGRPFATPVDVVRSLGAVQAQDYAGGKWGVAQRTRDATDAEVEQALTDGAVLRTHILRPTWHFVAAEDIRWMLALTAPRVRRIMSSSERAFGLDEKVFARSARLIAKALAGGNHLTRQELGRILARSIRPLDSQRLMRLMMRAELDALICSGVRRGKQFTYALLEERAPPAPHLEGDEALAELARRYFETRGPATVHDYSWWSGLTVRDCKRSIEVLGSRLKQATFDGRTYWFTASKSGAKQDETSVRLLPNYDEYFIGHKDRSAMQELVKVRVVGLPGDTPFANLVIADGQLVGGWSRIISPRSVVVVARLAVKLKASEQGLLEEQVARYGKFLGLPAQLEVAAST